MDQETLLEALEDVSHDDNSASYWLLHEFIMTHAEKKDVPVLLKKKKE